MTEVADTRRLHSKPQDLNDAYGPPSNFLEIDVFNPQIIGYGRGRYTTYEVHMRVGVRTTCQVEKHKHTPRCCSTDLSLTCNRRVIANVLASFSRRPHVK